MIESLQALSSQIENSEGKLHVFYGDIIDVLTSICKSGEIKAIYFNKDYSPFSIERDDSIGRFCKSRNIECMSYHDITLQKDFLEILENGEPILNYEGYFKAALSKSVDEPVESRIQDWANIDEENKFRVFDFKSFCLDNQLYTLNPKLECNVNREDFMAQFALTAKDKISGHLSSLVRFGVISPREIYRIFTSLKLTDSQICKNLFYRDFCFYVANYRPEIFNGDPLPAKYEFKRDEWDYDEEIFESWKEGKTGFPIIDASMRKLKQVGFLEHKLRFFTGLFLVRELNIEWRDGEIYYSNILVDIDWTLNIFNWVFLGATTIPSDQYKHNFKFWDAQKEFDPQCKFIKEWVVELRDVPIDDIHNWRTQCKEHSSLSYPQPIVDDYNPEIDIIKHEKAENQKRIKQLMFN
jgi:deoxyribodipyrimidine photo-lyase